MEVCEPEQVVRLGAGARRLRQPELGERDLPVRLKRRQTPERVVRGEGRAAEDDRVLQQLPRPPCLALVAAGEPEQKVEPAVLIIDGQGALEVVPGRGRPPLAVELHAEEVVERPVRARERRRPFEPTEPGRHAPLLYLAERFTDEPLELLALFAR